MESLKDFFYQEGSEESMRGSEFVFDRVDLLYYKFQKISLNRGGAYIYLLLNVLKIKKKQ